MFFFKPLLLQHRFLMTLDDDVTCSFGRIYCNKSPWVASVNVSSLNTLQTISVYSKSQLLLENCASFIFNLTEMLKYLSNETNSIRQNILGIWFLPLSLLDFHWIYIVSIAETGNHWGEPVVWKELQMLFICSQRASRGVSLSLLSLTKDWLNWDGCLKSASPTPWGLISVLPKLWELAAGCALRRSLLTVGVAGQSKKFWN